NAKPEITRFKGLGEMMQKELASTTLDPRNRTLLKVEIDNNHEAHTAFQELLGKDASPRYKFIMDKADQTIAEELDV
ncbi:MAG TPA: DNA topoisomerase IV subunit B, partial [Gemmata sp.]|nr:DNA topoisomerase IV subunit B [Gemmata sp.]